MTSFFPTKERLDEHVSKARCLIHRDETLVFEYESISVQQFDEPVGYVVTEARCGRCDEESHDEAD